MKPNNQRKLKAEKALERKGEMREAISEKVAEHSEEKQTTYIYSLCASEHLSCPQNLMSRTYSCLILNYAEIPDRVIKSSSNQAM